MDCLKDLVGITEDEQCPCLTNGCSEDDKAALSLSKSGIYADTIEGGIGFDPRMNANTCKSLCEMFLSARRTAEQTTLNDVLTGLGSIYQEAKRKYIGDLGERIFTRNAGPRMEGIIGMRMRFQSTDGLIKVKQAFLAVDRAATFNVYICRLYRGAITGDIIYTLPVTTQANILTEIPLVLNPAETAMLFPAMVNGVIVEYWIFYNLHEASGAIPKNNKTMCNCGEQTKLIRQYLYLEGVQAPSVTTLNEHSADAGFSYGFVLNTEIVCSQQGFVCREFDQKNAIALVLAYAIAYSIQFYVIDKILKNPETTRYTMMSREWLYGKRNHAKKEYDDRIQYIVKTADIISTDCYICRALSNDVSKIGILA